MTDENQAAFADRVWRAYWSLPRTKHGRPDSFHALEREFALANGILGKIVNNRRNMVSATTMAALAKALRTTMEYLTDGSGEAPTPTGPIPPRTEDHASTVEESAEHSTLKPSVSLEVQRTVLAAVDRAMHEATPEAPPHQVLALALMYVSMPPATK